MAHFNALFIPTLILALLLFAAGKSVALHLTSARATAVLLVLSTVMALPGLLFVAYYAHVLDRAAWFYAFRAAPYAELAAAGAGFGAGVLNRLLKRAVLVKDSVVLKRVTSPLLLCGLALLLFIPCAKPVIAPIQIPIHDQWSDGVCIQTAPSTCGPSSAATLLRQLGMQATERELAWECYSYGGGTENWYVARSLRRRGLAAEYLVTAPQPESLRFPSIAGTELGSKGGGGHFIAILGRDGDRYVVGDPLVGRLVLRPAELHARYYLTGFFLVVSRRS